MGLGQGGGVGWTGRLGLTLRTATCEQIASGNQLYSAGSSAQRSVATQPGGREAGKGRYMYT